MSDQISQNLSQKQHVEAVQALIWAIHLLKKKQNNEQITAQELEQYRKLGLKHKAAFEQEPQLRGIYNQLNPDFEYNPQAKTIAAELQKYEKDFLENLERKATRHKLSLFFAFFMALGCGTTLAGSNLLLAHEQGVLGVNAILFSLVIISFPIIAVVTMANWWLGVRDVFNLENKNKDPYHILKNRFGAYRWYKWPLFALGYILIELYNGLGLNLEEDSKPRNYTINKMLRVALNFTVLLGALIYAFFAFVTTFELGMGIFELLKTRGLASSSGFGAASGTSAGLGILMAIPTYITMKIIYFISARAMTTQGEGPSDIIDKIPNANLRTTYKFRLFGRDFEIPMPTLKEKFYFGAFFVIASIGSQTWAATEPLAHWLSMAGMAQGATILAGGLIGLAFIGNIPFFFTSAAKSFKQMYDPLEKLKFANNKWFPYIRFWNAVFNAIPAVVGFMAILGVASLNPFAFIALTIIGNVILSYASGEASYYANSNGSPDMYQFDPVKQRTQYNLAQLEELSHDRKAYLSGEELTADEQLETEYLGAKSYSEQKSDKGEIAMPRLTNSLYRVLTRDKLEARHQVSLYQALVHPPVTRYFTRLFSAIFHGNARYTQYVFPYDYLSRVERFASDEVKSGLYDAAFVGGGLEAAWHKEILSGVKPDLSTDYLDRFTRGPVAALFWKAYSVKSAKEQIAISHNLSRYQYEPLFADQILKHSRPEARDQIYGSQLKDTAPGFAVSNSVACYQAFTSANYWSLNWPTMSFWVNNLSFPFVMLMSGMRAVFSVAAQYIPVLGYLSTDEVSVHQFYSELASDEARKTYLSNVLEEHLKTHSSDTEARVLMNIIKDAAYVGQFDQNKSSSLTSGLVGMVFSLAGAIPSVRSRLEGALTGQGSQVKQAVVEKPEGVVFDAKKTFPLNCYDNYMSKRLGHYANLPEELVVEQSPIKLTT